MKKEIAKKTVDLKVIPLGDRVLLKPIVNDNKKSISGIIMPETIDKEKPETGKVVAVGEGKIDDGKRIPISVQVGQTVMFSKYGYDEIKIDDEEYYIVKEDSILAIIK